MPLDLFQQDQTEALSDASHRIAPDLPATWSDTFDAGLQNSIEWHNAAAYQFSKEHALNDYIADVRDKTGTTLPNPGYLVGATPLDDFNAAQQRLTDARPELDLKPLTPEDVDAMALKRMAATHSRDEAMSLREKTWGGVFGGLAGGLVGGFTDPVMIALAPLTGFGAGGILTRAAEFGALSGGSELVTDLGGSVERERAVPGSSAEIPRDVASATIFGAAFGGAFGVLGRLLGEGAKPLPTSLRDDVNAATSEAQLAATNPFKGVEAEMTHRDGIGEAVGQMARGEPVRVDTPAIAAEDHPFDAEASQRPLTIDERPDVEDYGSPPAAEDTFSYWDKWLETATPEQRAAAGAVDLAPETRIAPADEPRIDDTLAHDLEHMIELNPDLQYGVQTLQPDGTFRVDNRPLRDVLDEIDAMEHAGNELISCITGIAAGAAGAAAP